MNKKEKEKLLEFHNLVVKGLCNGLTHTHRDGRNNDIAWVRGRLELWESFGRTVFDYLIRLNDYSYSLKELKEVAELGYKKEEIGCGKEIKLHPKVKSKCGDYVMSWDRNVYCDKCEKLIEEGKQ